MKYNSAIKLWLALYKHHSDMKWITREKPKIDRIACPWLIKRFIDKDAEIIYVPFDEVIPRSKQLSAIPFDIAGVEYTHYNDECTFDYFLKKHKLNDKALHIIAPVVRGADKTGTIYLFSHQACGQYRQALHTIIKTTRNYLKKE